MDNIQHGTNLRMARRCERYYGKMCDECLDIKNAYQREMRERHPEWNRRSNDRARQRRRAMAILSYKYPDEFEKILQDVILRDE